MISAFASASMLLASASPAAMAATALPQTAAPTPSEPQAVPQPQSTTASPNPDLPAATEEPAVGDIVVTAQRRSERLQDVPISVTALSGQSLAAAGITSTAALPALTPSLSLSNSVGFVQPRIRGVGNSSAGVGVENSVAIYVDGVYISSAPGSLLSLNNIERVEVLKGPQGTLFGRNATGGLIQIVTRDPSRTLTGSADISYGNYDTVRANGYISGPLTSNLSADLSVSAGWQGRGYGKNLTDGRDIYRTYRELTVRSKVLWEIDQDTTARLSVDINSTRNNDPQPKEIAGTISSFYPVAIAYPSPWDVQLNGKINRIVGTGGASLRLEHNFGGVQLASISAYRWARTDLGFDADGTPIPAIFRSYIQQDRQYSQEVQLSSRGESKLKWVAGAFFYRLESGFADGHPFTDVRGGPLPAATTIIDVDSLTRSWAAYGQLTYEVFDRTNLTVGGRWTEETRSLTGGTGALNTAGVPVLTRLAPSEITFRTPTFRVSLDHKFSRDLMIFASYNRGFKSGGYNTQSPAAAPFKPEYLDSYELGLKSQLFNRTLRFNVSGFYYTYRDIQVNTFIAASPIIYNGARARTYGLDVDLDWAISPNFTLNGGATVLHDRFTSFPTAVVTIVLPGNRTTTGPGSATGNRLPFTPDAVFNLGATYKQDFDWGKVNLTVQNQYSTGFYGQADNFLRQRPYDLLSATLTLRPKNDHYFISVFGRNLTNEAVATFFSSSTTGQTASYQAPRTFGVRVGFDF